jgi:hypothetical protein
MDQPYHMLMVRSNSFSTPTPYFVVIVFCFYEMGGPLYLWLASNS